MFEIEKELQEIREKKRVIPATFDPVFKSLLTNENNRGYLEDLISYVTKILKEIISKNMVVVNNQLPIEKYNNRREITKDLYRFALQFDVPVFLNINGQYYLLNEIKFIDYNESDEYSILKNQFESFEAYFMKEIYGVSYDVLLKKENMDGVSITAKAYDTFNNMMQKSK